MKCIDFVLKQKNDPVLPMKLLFIQVIIFRLEILHCCVDQGHEKCHSWLDLVTYGLEHEVRLVFHRPTIL